MKKLYELSKKELLKQLPEREWNNTTKLYDQVWIIPAGTKHDSGYMHISLIGVWYDKNEYQAEICGYPDDVSYFFQNLKNTNLPAVHQDCFYPNGVLRFHSIIPGKFRIGESLSSQCVYWEEAKK